MPGLSNLPRIDREQTDRRYRTGTLSSLSELGFAGGDPPGQGPNDIGVYPGARPGTQTLPIIGAASAYPGARPGTQTTAPLAPTTQTTPYPGSRPGLQTTTQPNPFLTPEQNRSMINYPAGGPGALTPQTGGGQPAEPWNPSMAVQPDSPEGVGSSDDSYYKARQALGRDWQQDDATIAAHFDRLMKIDPYVAMKYAELNPRWQQQNQFQIKDRYFGGDAQKFNTWINTNASAGYSNRSRDNIDVQRLLLTTLPNGGAAPAGTPATGTGTTPAGTPPPAAGTGSTPTAGTGGVDPAAPGGPATGESGAPLSSLAGNNYDIDVSKFLDPAMAFRIKQATEAAQTSAAARGNLQSGSTVQAINDRANNIAGEEWGRAFDRADADRRFAYGVDVGDRDFGWNAMRDDRDFKFNVDKYNSDMEYRREFDNRNHNFDVYKYNTDNAYKAAIDNREYQFNKDRYEQEFRYRAETGDRAYDYTRLNDLMKFGMEALRTGALTDIELARIISQNITGGANAGAAGEIGQNSAVVRMIMDFIRQGQFNLNT